MSEIKNKPTSRQLSISEIGALAHLYRGEVYRSTTWRTRLDTTTNWSVVTLGVSLSITFSSANASPIPLILVGFLIMFFMALEARRYRYFNVWRARARWMETHFFAPMLVDGDLHMEDHWQKILAEDYRRPRYHVSLIQAMGRRIRQNYLWILLIQSLAFIGKIVVHPTPATSMAEIWDRTTLGPIPGQITLIAGGIYVFSWILLAYIAVRSDRIKYRRSPNHNAMG